MKAITPENRAKYDHIFMQVIQSVQAEAQNTHPEDSGALAKMFHREQVTTTLQQCAILIAAWNNNSIDLKACQKCAAALKALGLANTAERVSKLVHIDEV